MSELSSQHDPPEDGPSISAFNVAFWNLQNLFDIQASKLATDLEFTPVHGWDRRAFEMKVRNLAEIIKLMFDGKGPDLLGLCEVENERVANTLIKAIGREDYALAHVEHPDIRGIDTSLIYSTEHFEVNEERTSGHLVHLRYPTRDIFEVHMKVKANDTNLVVLVNHWPSRSMGRLESDPFRMTVASHCGQIVDQNLKLPRRDYLKLVDNEESLQQLNEAWDRNVLLMGDFNDEPWSRSVLDILRAGFSTDHLEEPIRFARGCLPSFKAYAGKSAALFNPMWALLNRPDVGTHHYSQATQTMHILDQFMLSRGLYFGLDGLKIVEQSPGIPDVEIFQPEVMCTRKGRPREFQLENRRGYSDHFPITTSINVLPLCRDTPAGDVVVQGKAADDYRDTRGG